MTQPDVIKKINQLIQLIICGEDITIDEETEQFRLRIEAYAIEIEKMIYNGK